MQIVPQHCFFKQNKQHVKQAGKKGKTLRQDTTNASKRKINKLQKKRDWKRKKFAQNEEAQRTRTCKKKKRDKHELFSPKKQTRSAQKRCKK